MWAPSAPVDSQQSTVDSSNASGSGSSTTVDRRLSTVDASATGRPSGGGMRSPPGSSSVRGAADEEDVGAAVRRAAVGGLVAGDRLGVAVAAGVDAALIDAPAHQV